MINCLRYLLVLSSFLGADLLVAQNEKESIDSLVDLFNKKHCFNGEILITVDDKPFYQTQVGYRDIRTKERIIPNSVFNIGSISKPFTSVAILQLQEKGLLNIDDMVVKYIPEFPYENIRIKHLLSHTSGVIQNLEQIEDFKISGYFNNDSLQAVLSRYKPQLSCVPGSEFIYSNIGYQILASVVERVTKMKFPEYMRKNIFEPAGMSRTFIPSSEEILLWLPSDVTEKEMLVPHNYKSIHDCEVTPGDSIDFSSGRWDFLLGSEKIYSCLGDLAKFDEALRKNKILGKEMQEMAYTPFVLSTGDTAKDMKSPIPSYYGLGWFISIDQTRGRIIWHKGRSMGSRSIFLRNPEKQQVVGATDNFDYTAVDLKGIACFRILNHESYRNPVLISLVQQFGCGIYSNGFPAALSDFKVRKDTERQNYYISMDETIQLMNDLVTDKKSTDALSLMQYATELFPASPEVFTGYGKLLIDADSAEKAISIFKQAVLLSGPTDREREALLNDVGYDFLVLNQLDNAELVLKLNTELFPNSGNTYDSYATVLEKNNKVDQAIRMEKKAVAAATKNQDELLETFQKNLEALEAKK
jgi:CubicO group peptidase (beta-lactamase class C family)